VEESAPKFLEAPLELSSPIWHRAVSIYRCSMVGDDLAVKGSVEEETAVDNK